MDPSYKEWDEFEAEFEPRWPIWVAWLVFTILVGGCFGIAATTIVML